MVKPFYDGSGPWDYFRWFNRDLEGVSSIYWNITMPLAHSLKRIEEAGMMVNIDMLQKVDAQYRADLERLEYEWGNMTNDVNYKSTKDLGEFLFHELELPIIKVSRKTGKPATGAPILEKLVGEHECIQVLLDLKKKKQALANFLGGLDKAKGMIQWIESDGRVHPNYRVDGTDSGRLSSYGPNGQNISKDPNIRKLFCARPGYAFVECDYAALELRIPAIMWNDAAMLRAFQDGGDPHAQTASVMFNKPQNMIIKSERDEGKTVNFAVLYLTSAWSLAFRLNRTVEECEEYIRSWFRLYSNIRKGIRETQRNAAYLGYTDNMFGRRRRLPELTNPNKSDPDWKKHIAHLNRVAANFAIQSTGSDVLSCATNQLIYDPSPEFKKTGAVPIASIHDALFFEVPIESAIDAAHMIKDTMEIVPKLILGEEWNLVAEAKVGYFWSDSSILKLEK